MDIYSRVLKINERYGRRLAMSMTLASGEVRKYTYQELLDQTSLNADKLSVAGISSGDRVALVAENSPNWQSAFLAALKLRATVVLIDADLPIEALRACLKKADVRCILTSEKVKEKLGESTAYRVPVLNMDESCLAFSDSYGVLSPFMPRTEDPDASVAMIFFELDENHEVKGVMYSHEAMLRQVEMIADEQAVSRGDRILSVIPNSHIEGMVACVLTSLLTGSSIHYVEALDEETLSRAFKVQKPTIFPAPQSVLAQLKEKLMEGIEGQRFGTSYLERCERLRKKLGLSVGSLLFKKVHQALGGHLELIWCYGPIDEEVVRFYYSAGIDILMHYGRVETNIPVLGNRENHMTVDTCGKPYPEIEIQLMHPNEKGEGEMYIKAPNGMMGYFRDPERMAASFEEEWYKTGDLARLEPSGNVKVLKSEEFSTLAEQQENDGEKTQAVMARNEGLPNKDERAYSWFKTWKEIANHLYRVHIQNDEYLPKEGGYIIYSPFETQKGYMGLTLGYSKAQFFKFGYLSPEAPSQHFKSLDKAYGKIHFAGEKLAEAEKDICLEQLKKGWGIIIKAPKDAINAELTDEVITIAKEANVPIVPVYLEGEEALFSGKEDFPRLFNLKDFKRYSLNLRYGKPIATTQDPNQIKRQIQGTFTALIENQVMEEPQEEVDELTQLAMEMLSPKMPGQALAVTPEQTRKEESQIAEIAEREEMPQSEAQPEVIEDATDEMREENATHYLESLDLSELNEEEEEAATKQTDLSSLLAIDELVEAIDTQKIEVEEASSTDSPYNEEITFESSCLSKEGENQEEV